MELKMYVLVEKNGIYNIIDTKNEWKKQYEEEGRQPQFKGYEEFRTRKNQKYSNLIYHKGYNNIKDDLGEILATSDNILMLVKDNDYVRKDGILYRVYLYEGLNSYEKNLPYSEKLRVENLDSPDFFLLKGTYDGVYKWQGKNLICMWNKNNE